MKKSLLIALCMGIGSVYAQEEKIIELGDNSVNDVFYQLHSGDETEASATNWDIAFQISGWSASIRANTAQGIEVQESSFGPDDWESFSDAEAGTWDLAYDSESSWSEGAFNQNISGEVDLGWGTYDMVTHFVTGDHIYLIKLQNGDYKKLLIEDLKSGVYTIKYANVDGSDEQTAEIAKADYENKAFAYFSLQNNTAADREPVSESWDLVFGKYTAMLAGGTMPYGVSGIRTNDGVMVAKYADVNVAETSYDESDFVEDNITEIGYDWKSFDGSGYVIAEDLCYFVKDQAGNIFKLIFTSYGGNAAGTIGFTQELLFSVGIEETVSNPQLKVYPNPASQQNIQVLYEWQQSNTTNASLQLRDLSGRQVWSQAIQSGAGFYQQELPTANMPAGVYLLELSNGQQQWHQKVVIQ